MKIVKIAKNVKNSPNVLQNQQRSVGTNIEQRFLIPRNNILLKASILDTPASLMNEQRVE